MGKNNEKWASEHVLKVTEEVAMVMFNLGRGVYIKRQEADKAASVLLKSAVKKVSSLPKKGTAIYVDA